MKLEDGVEELKEHYMELKEVLQVIREEFPYQLNIRGIRWLEPDDIPEIKADRLSMAMSAFVILGTDSDYYRFLKTIPK